MVAENTSLDPMLKRMYSEELLTRLKMPDWTSPAWRAWAKEWREEVPLTPEQEQANRDWRTRVVPEARQRLREAEAAFQAAMEGIETAYAVHLTDFGDGGSEWDVDAYEPPHKTTYRTKDGAPPEPAMWPIAAGNTVKFVRFGDKPTETQKGKPG